MKFAICLAALSISLITSTKVIAADTAYDISQEAQQFTNELNSLNDESNQKIISDPNYSDKVKMKVNDKLSKMKIKEEDVQKFLNDTNVSEKKKHQAIKELNKIKSALGNKLHKEKAEDIEEQNDSASEN